MSTLTNGRRRLYALAASLAVAAAATIAIATPSSAIGDPPPPGPCSLDKRLDAGNGYIEGFNRRICGGEPTVNLAVNIFQKVGARWVLVAQGSGTAIYKCKGTALTTYSMDDIVKSFHCS